MSDTESSEDENLELLREAADSEFINDDMFKEKKEPTEAIIKSLPSLRQQSVVDDHNDLLEISQETRAFIGRKLSEVLDKKLEKLLSHDSISTYAHQGKKVKSRVKLFHDSMHYIRCEKPAEIVQKRRIEDVDENNEENCKAVAVSAEDILSHKETKHWSTRTKAKVFSYKRNNEGQLIEATW